MLREMARHRGFKLVKSRRRKQGGDHGKFGLADAKSGKKCFGYGEDGLTASPEDIESYLRTGELSTWKKSVGGARRQAPKAAETPPAKAETPAGGRPKVPEKKAPAKPKREPEPPTRPKRQPEPELKPEPAPELKIRKAGKGDAEALAGLLAGLGDGPDAKAVAARLAALARAGTPMLVAERGLLVGCSAWQIMAAPHRPLMGRLTLVAVAADARRQGIGRMLVEASEAAMRKKGCTAFEAVSAIDFSGAQSFFRNLGYEKAGYRFAKPISL